MEILLIGSLGGILIAILDVIIGIKTDGTIFLGLSYLYIYDCFRKKITGKGFFEKFHEDLIKEFKKDPTTLKRLKRNSWKIKNDT